MLEKRWIPSQGEKECSKDKTGNHNSLVCSTCLDTLLQSPVVIIVGGEKLGALGYVFHSHDDNSLCRSVFIEHNPEPDANPRALASPSVPSAVIDKGTPAKQRERRVKTQKVQVLHLHVHHVRSALHVPQQQSGAPVDQNPAVLAYH